MPLDNNGLNVAANAVADAFPYLALFDGATEISGGSPAYARKLTSNAVASGGVVEITGTPYVFNIPAGATVSHFALFDALTGGNRGGLEALSASEGPYAAQGEYSFTDGSISFT